MDDTLEPRPLPVYLLLHPVEPVRRNAIERVRAACIPHVGLPAFNASSHRAGESGKAGITAARTAPMMAPMRLVEITDLQDASNDFFGALKAYLASPSDTTVLMISGAGFPKVVKGGKRWSTVIAKAMPSGSWTLDKKVSLDARRFAEQVARTEGSEIAPDAARALGRAFDQKLGLLEQEVRKLALFADGTITAQHVTEVTGVVGEAAVWDLTGAIVSRDRQKALLSLQRLQNQGNDSRQILGSLAWKMRSLTIAADGLRRGASDGGATRASGLKSFELRKLKDAMRTGFPSTADLLSTMAQAHFDMNGHRAGDRRIIERLIMDWTA